jgi:hypothetical protein
MDHSLLLKVIRRSPDGNDWKGDVKGRCGYCCARRARASGCSAGSYGVAGAQKTIVRHCAGEAGESA